MRIGYTHKGINKVFDNDLADVVIGFARSGVAIGLDLAPDEFVSSPHARVWIESGRYWIEDLKSSRGTRVNGENIKGMGKRRLQAGDTIQLGETVVHVEFSAGTTTSKVLESSSSTLKQNVEIGHSLDATISLAAAFESAPGLNSHRQALLLDLPLRFGAEGKLEALLDMVVVRLVEAIPGATRGTLALLDHETGQLLPKAYFPETEPVISETLARRAMANEEGFVWHSSREGVISQSIRDYHIEAGMYVPLRWAGVSLGVLCVDNSSDQGEFSNADLQFMLAVAHYAAMAVANYQMREDLKRNAKLMERLLTSFSPKIRDKLLEKAHDGRLRPGGEKSEVTILCSDIRGFTRTTAEMDCADVVDMLNDYFTVLSAAIFEHDGTIDKFIGDAVLAVFGSPEPDSQQTEKAIRAAIGMQEATARLNVARQARGDVTCNIGIGVHCGEVVHGFIGTSDRMEFTVIGNAVNGASRFCSGARAGEVLISPEVYQRTFRTVNVEQKTIATKEGERTAYQVTGLKAPSAT